MHSSRMRTGRSLTVCRGGGSSPCRGVSLLGGVLLAQGEGVSLLGGVLPAGGYPCQGGLLARGVSLPGGFSLLGGLLAKGGLLAGGGLPAGGGSPCLGGLPARGVSLPETPPPSVDRITDTSKNITLATTSLRPVKRKSHFRSNVMESLCKEKASRHTDVVIAKFLIISTYYS